ncbi:hypothetical protein JX265_006757 [Neoarthrinium moseri]|uniref:Enoyl reductase (ER) domain-containing protein n=1 Tax=Neoarthrinium moseri TaxID=1658444 RepID=A0A9Q0AP21_9PEZI|nr:uncharacterized protein JN550_002771 [Neoarthrinium moseri]KAI1847050.1 hypothetical protein JX266_006925 [Neoarthrinium moseri]KAI1868778.1 hypothetical protein JX265_006757 [Neoarthrinium moseri]KAI1874192.1 hypothetical protein JN550_002771 [Neoarthrinium moseri]
MAAPAQTMRAWLYTSASGGLEHALKLSEAALPPLAKDQIRVQVHSTSINPIDYKLPEMGVLARAMIPVPAAPGLDFAGTVARVGGDVEAADTFRVGEKVYGRIDPAQHGTLGEYVTAKTEWLARLPEAVSLDEASCVGTAGITAYQAIVPNVKAGDKVFINGGSGGTGTFGIQVAKSVGCHVTASCSGKNVDLCKSLGADEVIDYTQANVSETLKAKGQVFKLVVDNVGAPADLYKAADHYLLPEGKFVQIGGGMSLSDMKTMTSRMAIPSFLGGGKRSYQFMLLKTKNDDLVQFGKLMSEGKVKAVIDEKFAYEDAPKAFAKLKTGRSKGNLVIKVSQ